MVNAARHERSTGERGAIGGGYFRSYFSGSSSRHIIRRNPPTDSTMIRVLDPATITASMATARFARPRISIERRRRLRDCNDIRAPDILQDKESASCQIICFISP